MRHILAVIVAIVGSVLVATPSWIRAALSPPWQSWMDSTLTFDVNTVRKAYLVFVPIGVFWATYKAWKEQNDARIAAEKLTPPELQKEVRELAQQLEQTKADLASQRRRTLSSEQREILSAACAADLRANPTEPLRFGVYYNLWNTEAGEYAINLCEIFSSAGMSGVPTSTNEAEIASNLEGVIIRMKDVRTPPNGATRLSALLKKGLISHGSRALNGPRSFPIKEDYFDLVIGRSSAPQDVLDREIRLLKQGQQRTLNRTQLKAIRDIQSVAAQKGQRLIFSIKIPYGDLEAEKYAKDFGEIFNCGISYDNKIGADLADLIVIRVKDVNLVPVTASYLEQALKAADIHYKTDSLELDFPINNESGVELIIGSKQ
jgi:hypothetical protein